MQTTSTANGSAPRLDFHAPQRFLEVGKNRLPYWRTGSGPDLVFLHGWPVSSATFRNVVPRLAGSFTCHLFDLPGAGLSEWSDDSVVEMREHVKTARAAIDQLGLASYAIVAHDSGGFIGRHVAADDPRVTGLVLGNTEIPGHTPPMLVAYALLAKYLGGGLLRSVLRSKRLRASAIGFGGCFQDASFVNGDFADWFVEPILRSDRVLAGALALLRNANGETMKGMKGAHAKIRVPVRLVWGTDDPWFPLAKARPMLAQFGGRADLVEIPGGKLFVHEDHAKEFADAALAFLRT
jgi:haloalkane dehalogenase